jgi:hypothetical protein
MQEEADQMPDGLEETTRDLVGWAQEVLPDLTVAARALGDRDSAEGVDIRLIALAPRPAPRTVSPPLVVALDYLLIVRAADPIAEQTGVMALMLAAMDHENAEVVADRDALRLCADLGLSPAPGFVMRALVSRRRTVRTAPLVRFPLKVATGEFGVLQGSVLGPNDTPVAGALVRAEGLQRTAQTDAFGRFRLYGPVGGVAVRLNARARGVVIDGEAEPGLPVILRLPLEI